VTVIVILPVIVAALVNGNDTVGVYDACSPPNTLQPGCSHSR
jgi:hypothetical protein